MTGRLELAQRALAAVREGDAAQATVTAERSLLLRFARSRATQATSVDDVAVEISVLCDGQLGSASTNRTGPDGLAACARAAEAAGRAGGRRGGASYPGLPPPAPFSGHHGHDPSTARLDPARGRQALVAAFERAAAHGVEAHGIWTAGEVETAIATSSGIAAEDRVTDAAVKVTCVGPAGRSGYAAASGVAADDVDPAAVAESAALKSTSGGEPTRLPPGDYPVVLEPHAVAELLGWIGRLAFNGLAYAEDRSPLCRRLQTQVAAPAVNLSDSPRYPGTLPRSFDAEGVPKQPLPLIQDGVAHAVVHDTRSGALVGERSTGHALATGGSPRGALPTNLVLLGGGASDERELCRPIERGVYVTRLWYTNPVRPKETLITGVTRDGTFLIEDGELAGPLADLRLTDSALGVLARTQALGRRPLLVGATELYGRRFATGTVCPPLRASALRFTGVVP